MKSIHFEIIEDNNCPLYELGDSFELSDKVLNISGNKQVCLILVRELTQLLFALLGGAEEQEGKKVHSCSGCTGLIKFSQLTSHAEFEISKQRNQQMIVDLIRDKFGMIVKSPLLQVLQPGQVKKLLSVCYRQEFVKDQLIVRKGEVNKVIFIVLSGQVAIEDGPIKVNTLGEGELFGEMSYLGKNVATTGVRAVRDTSVLAIGSDDFSKLQERNSSVQLYMARLLALRLSEANKARANDFDVCMSGRLNEIVPAELFQVFHMHQKTGVLSLEFPQASAHVSFRLGSMINARYGELENEEAVYAIIGEREGVYKFTAGLSPEDMVAAEIGDFMGLLMEGVKKLDEADNI